MIRGDNKLALLSLSRGSAREEIEALGGLKLVYIDPPFNVGTDFYTRLPIGDSGAMILKTKAYSDRWAGNFYDMLRERLVLIRELLAEDGCVFVHCDWRTNSRTRLLLDEIFHFYENEIIWHYTGGGRSSKHFSRKHDTIYLYSKSGKLRFFGDAIRIPYKETSGYARSGVTSRSGKKYLPNPGGTIPDDVWDIPIINPLSSERTGYPTQKPEALIERVLLACSSEGDLVADFFCGSGAFPAVAQKLRRRWIAVDASPLAVSLTKKRLLALSSSFDHLELAPSYPDAAIDRILDAWGARKIDDDFFSGVARSRPVVVSLAQADRALLSAAIERCRRDKIKGIDFLAVDFAPDGLPWALREAEKHCLELRFRRVAPHVLDDYSTADRAAFFPAAYPIVEPVFVEDTLGVKLTGYEFCASFEDKTFEEIFRLASGETPPAWSDWIDYWAVDFESGAGRRDETIFYPQWRSFREGKNRTLELSSEFRPINSAPRKIVAKTVDIFGAISTSIINVIARRD